MNNKSSLRTSAKNIRKTLPLERISETIVKKIRSNAAYQNAKNVMIFYPLKYEINLLDLLADDKNFFLPRVEGEHLEVCSYAAGEKLKKSELKILEPTSAHVNPAILDLVILPALMADKHGYRLGYGGGFYDRFLAESGFAGKAITVVPDVLLVENLPVDEFDIKTDRVITN